MSKNIVIIAGSFHKKEVGVMLTEARKVAKGNGLKITREIWVPGSFEQPLALKQALSSKNVDAAVVLGIIEKGDTKHGLVMAQAVFSAIINLQLEFNKPIGVAILGPEILPGQIPPRLKPFAQKAVSAIKEMLEICSPD